MDKSHVEKLNWIDEIHEDVRYGLKAKVILDEYSDYQRITIIESNRYGKGLLLDSCWMTAEFQEKHYHEALVHPALCSANDIKRVLIIGGGDGGTAKECLRHKQIKNLDLIEIDNRVIEVCQEYLPGIGSYAWKDPRLNIKIEDGITWVSNAHENSYDVIIVDGSDPKGPAKGLFNRNFYENCKRILKPGGVFATQSESPESFFKIHIEMVQIIREVFNFADPLYGWVPMYPSGWWSWTFASKESPIYLNPMKERADQIKEECEIWSIRWQQGAFHAMPAFVERALEK